MKRTLLALLVSVVVGSALAQSPQPARIRIATWNLEWFPNGSPHDAAPEKQAQRNGRSKSLVLPGVFLQLMHQAQLLSCGQKKKCEMNE
jgi:hypothetical protein